jgi:hypothetical protein
MLRSAKLTKVSQSGSYGLARWRQTTSKSTFASIKFGKLTVSASEFAEFSTKSTFDEGTSMKKEYCLLNTFDEF